MTHPIHPALEANRLDPRLWARVVVADFRRTAAEAEDARQAAALVYARRCGHRAGGDLVILPDGGDATACAVCGAVEAF